MTHQHATNNDISRTIARLKAGILALVCALIFGFALFTMTVWLLLKGGSHVGAHLGLLNNYFIGYSVTWGGAFVGLFYGLVLGGIVGWMIGIIYNRVAGLRNR